MQKKSINFWTALPRPIIALAPMVGISDTSFRQMAIEWGADVVYSEMISADALVHGAAKAHAMMSHAPTEKNFVVQIMGKDTEVLSKAARIAEKIGAAGIDINFGCPAHKIAKNFCGAMLMRDLNRCRSLIAAVIESASIPVSIKVRVSIKPERSNTSHSTDAITILDMLEKIQDLPIAAIMVHGRSFEDPFEGGIRTEMIRAVKERFTTGPVLANGGITTVESAKKVLEETAADGLGMARSVIGKPWVFGQVKKYLSEGTYDPIPWQSVKETIIRHVELFEAHRGQTPFRDIRRHLTHYVRGHEHASEIRQQLTQVNTEQEVKKILAKY